MCVSGCVYRTADSDATVRGEVAGDPGQFVTPSVQLCVSGCVYSTVDSDATVRGEVAALLASRATDDDLLSAGTVGVDVGSHLDVFHAVLKQVTHYRRS